MVYKMEYQWTSKWFIHTPCFRALNQMVYHGLSIKIRNNTTGLDPPSGPSSLEAKINASAVRGRPSTVEGRVLPGAVWTM